MSYLYLQRDAKRRLTHNEVERRRRDKINQWIMYMSKIIPDCAEENKTNYDNQVIFFKYFFQITLGVSNVDLILEKSLKIMKIF